MPKIASRRAKTVSSVLQHAPVSRLDAELLLAKVLRKDRAWLLAHSDEAVPSSTLSTFQSLLRRRQVGEPLAYIIGEKEFYGRMFHVDRRVMIPRPSTEALIDEVKCLWRDPRFQFPESRTTKADTGIVVLTYLKEQFFTLHSPFCIADIGTGSGCIAITLALELPEAKIIASDISEQALEVARINAKLHGVLDRITFLHATGLPAYLPTSLDVLLVSNPPYLRTNRDEDPSTACEPRAALYAGADGLDVLLPLIQQARGHPRCIGFVIECLEEHVSQLNEA